MISIELLIQKKEEEERIAYGGDYLFFKNYIIIKIKEIYIVKCYANINDNAMQVNNKRILKDCWSYADQLT